MSLQDFDIIFFALVAGFLILRLRSVLGQRNGKESRDNNSSHEEEILDSSKRKTKTGFLPKFFERLIQNRKNIIPRSMIDEDKALDKDIKEAQAFVIDEDLPPGITDIMRADRRFNVEDFIAGAKLAYERILNAYAAGDEKRLVPLLSADVYKAFKKEMDKRKSSGQRMESTIVSLKSNGINAASLENNWAFITIGFVSEQINVVYDKLENLVSGSPDKVEEVTDLWGFSRRLDSSDLNWILTSTRIDKNE